MLFTTQGLYFESMVVPTSQETSDNWALTWTVFLIMYVICVQGRAHVGSMCTFWFYLEPPLLCVFSFSQISLSLGRMLSCLDLGANNKNENPKEQGILLLQGTNRVISSRFFIVYMRKFRPRKTSAWLSFHNWLALTRRHVQW